jgi:glycosyltransferase involved in cell wall biosynthesis
LLKILSVIAGILLDDAMSKRILNINRLLIELGHQVHLVQYAEKKAWLKTGGNAVDLSVFDHSIVFSPKALTNLTHLRGLGKENYDLMYGNTYGGAFWSILGKLKHVPLIYDMHGSAIEEHRLNTGNTQSLTGAIRLLSKTAVETAAISFSDRIVCVSNKMMLYLKKYNGGSSKKTYYVTNGVDLNLFKPVSDVDAYSLKRKLGLDGKFVFGYIGDTQKWQGLANFIYAAKLLRNPNVQFLVVGTNQNKTQKAGNLLFVPRVSHIQVPLYAGVCNVLVLPRPTHPATEIAAPTKFAEYAAMGKPILTTNVGDAAELVTRYNCGLVTKKSAAVGLLEGFGSFTQKPVDLLREMGHNSRELAETEFDWNKIKWNLSRAIAL